MLKNTVTNTKVCLRCSKRCIIKTVVFIISGKQIIPTQSIKKIPKTHFFHLYHGSYQRYITAFSWLHVSVIKTNTRGPQEEETISMKYHPF